MKQNVVLLSTQVPVNTSEHLCPGPGYYPYDSDCSRFYKCRRDSRGKIEGYMYECPSGYAFWEISRRCEKMAKLPSCERGERRAFSEAPIERRNVGTRKLKHWSQKSRYRMIQGQATQTALWLQAWLALGILSDNTDNIINDCKSPAVSTATRVILHQMFVDYWTPNLKSA
jgi:hypothetical protein